MQSRKHDIPYKFPLNLHRFIIKIQKRGDIYFA